MKRHKVLWLPAWYPEKNDFLNGDFTDRHARAAAKFNDVFVIFVTKDFSLIPGKTNIEVEEAAGLLIYRGYYNSSFKRGFFSKLKSVGSYYSLLWKLYRTVNKKHGSFNLVHVHISLRQGLLAHYLKYFRGIPYIITEQNSWFMPYGNRDYPTNVFLRNIIKVNFRNAAAIHTVSRSLGLHLKEKFKFIKDFTVIPNVVDTAVFNYEKITVDNPVTKFFCVNGNKYHKNTDGIVRAFSNLLSKGYKGSLHIAGPNNGDLKVQVNELGIKEYVFFYGAVSYPAVAQLMKESDAFIFFTRYETFGCVMAEALCCGRPLIASRIPVLEEQLTEFENGLFVNSEDEADLAEQMIFFSENKHLFNGFQISEKAHAKFNFDIVGQAFSEFYFSVIKSDKN